MLKLVALQLVVRSIFCSYVYTAVMDRTEILMMNDKYIENTKMYTRRYGRQSPYYLNIEVTTKHTWNNNVSCSYVYTAVMDRTEILMMNDKYIENTKMYTRRYGRQSPYYLNIEVTTKHTWNNNVSMIVDLKEKLSNMYKPSFVNFRWGLCDLVANDHIFGTTLRRAGLMCPAPPGHYQLRNLTVYLEDFPDVIPVLEGRANTMAVITKTNEVIFNGYVYFAIKKIKMRAKSDKITKG